MDYHRHKALEEGLAEFFQHSHSRQYPSKTIIVRPGDATDKLYFIRDGSVSVCMENEEGEELIVAYLNQGDFIGEVGFFSTVSSGDRLVTVRARSDCRTEELSYQQIRAMADNQLKNSYPVLLQTLAEQLARRLLSTTRKATDMAFLDVAGRVIAALEELTTQPDAMRTTEGMQIRVTRQEISRIVGCSREMVGRVLKELQERGMIWAHGKTVVLYNDAHRRDDFLLTKKAS